MKHKEFLKKEEIVSQKYRAVCNTNDEHWKGVWRSSYEEAFNDGDKHRYGNNGNNQFHDITIMKKIITEAKVD